MSKTDTAKPTVDTPISANTILKLPPPSFVILEPHNGQGEPYREDSFTVLRMLVDAEKKPTEQQRWDTIKKWIAEKLKIPETEVTESMALFLHQQVVTLTNQVRQDVSKNVFTIASSQQPTQESPVNS